MRGLYFGWFMVFVAMIAYTMLAGVTFASFSVFVLPVSKEFALSRADTNSALILLSAGAAIFSPLVGRLVDRFPMRRILIAGIVVLSASLVAISQSRSLWLSAFIILIPLPIALQGAGYLSMSVLVARWFGKQRSRAMALSMVGMSFGSIFVPPIVGLLVTSLGWRTALMMAGLSIAAIMLPLFALVRDRPGPQETEPGNAGAAAISPARVASTTPVPATAILRTPAFWTIVVSCGSALAIGQGVIVSLVPMAQDAGISAIAGASLLSAAGVSALAGKAIIVAIGDRVDRLVLLSAMFALLALANMMFLAGHSYTTFLSAAVALGIGSSTMPVFFALVADRFGLASFGTAQGLMFPITAIQAAASMRFAGEVFDRTGRYDLMFQVYGAIMIAAIVLLLSTKFIDAGGWHAPQGPQRKEI